MIGAAIRKDALLLLRDRGALISLFALPVVFMLVFGAMFKFGPDAGLEQTIAIWSPAEDVRGKSVERALEAAPGFTPAREASPEAVRAAVAREAAAAGVIFPSSPDAPIEVVIDLAAPAQVLGPLQGALVGILEATLAPRPATGPGASPRIELRPPTARAASPEITSAFQITVPGNAVLFGFFIALTVAMAFTGERRSGTWRRLLAAPVPRYKALLATLVPYYLVGLCQMAFLFGIGAAGFGMQVAGSVVGLILVSLAVTYCAVSLGLLFASLGGSEKQLGGIGSVVLLVMGMLGGCMMPRIAMPAFMQSLGLAVPHAWALDAYFDVLIRPGTTVLQIAPKLGVLLAFGTGFAALGASLFRYER